MGFDPRPHYRWIDWLGDEIHRTYAESMGFLRRVTVGSHKNDGDIAGGGVGFELGADLKTVHAWHDDIQQHQIGRVGLADRQSLFTVGGHEHLIVGTKHLVHNLYVDGLVVDHKQLGLAVRAVQ